MKRVLVTGGTVRLGLAMVECLRARGWDVVTSSHRPYSGADFMADFTKSGAAEKLFSRVGHIDALVNNAELFGEAEGLRAVNYDSPRRLIELMSASGGAVVNILDASHGEGEYYVLKAKLAAYTVDAAKLYAPKLRVNGVAPGAVFAPEGAHVKAGRNLVGRPKAEDVASAVAFLLENGSVTGTIIPVDGGSHIA